MTATPPLPDNADRRVVELDARGRVAIGKYASQRQYVLTVAADGVITLSPLAALLTANEYEQLTGKPHETDNPGEKSDT